MNILLLKYVHIVSVAVSFGLFFVRGLWLMRSYPEPQEQWVRVLPYVVDTALVVSALVVMMMSPQKGWPGDWLSVKLVLVVIYAALVLYLFRWARGRAPKVVVWIVALIVFLFVTTISVVRDPLVILSLL